MFKKFSSLSVLICVTIVTLHAQVQQTWQNLTNTTNSSGALSKTTTAGWNGAGGRSRNTLFANTDGWIEFTIDNNASAANYIIGFSSINNVYVQEAIDFGIEVNGLQILSHQSNKTGTALGSVVVGDVIRISRVGSTITYYQNGVVKSSVGGNAAMYYIPKVIINYGISSALTTSFSPLAETGEIPNALEQSVLVDMYNGMGGSTWTNSPYWPMTGTLPVNNSGANGVWIVNGDITRIYLQSCNVAGTLPMSFGYLSKLVYVFLMHNSITGVLPESIGNLSDLGYLYLEYNSITGDVPASLGNASNLSLLHLGANKFASVPPELTKLSKLTDLSINGNSFTNLPDYSALTKVTYLNIAANPYTSGPFPSWILAMHQLTNLYINNANLTGSIPATIGTDLPLLTNLDLSGNMLSSGSLPASIGSMTKMQSLKIRSSQLTNSLPDAFSQMTDLWNLDLGDNKLSGSIPLSLCSLLKLQTLDLSKNQLTGSIPVNIGGITKTLKTINLFTNQLSGKVPASLGSVPTLVTLDLSDNRLSGEIPSELGSIATLQTLNLRINQLIGSIPSTLGSLGSLTTFMLSDNQLTGEIPSTLGDLHKVIYFHLHINQLTGEVPPSVAGLNAVQQFAINNNKLSGQLPATLSNLTNLTLLQVNNNFFTGSIPDVFTPLTKLQAVNFAYNQFSGTVPSSILNVPLLNSIILNDNDLSAIPNFGTYVNKAGVTVTIQNNRLDFSQLEPLMGAGIKSLTYTPYKEINDVTSATLTVGSPFVLTCRPTGSFSTVYWEKLGSNNQWTVLTNDQDAVATTYTRSSAANTDEGTYRWRMTNTKAGGTIQSTSIVVKTASRVALDAWAFQYKYDARHRMIAKKVPGADWVYMVYDDRDRLVLTQDGNQRSGTGIHYWTFTKYDELNRPIMTGIKDTTAGVSQAEMQNAVNTYYSLMTTTKTFRKYGEVFKGTSTASTVHGYTNYSYPRVTTGVTVDGYRYLTVTYYDNYDFKNDWVGNYDYVNEALHAENATGVYDQTAQNQNVIGQVTGTKTKVLDGGLTGGYTWLKAVTYYDDKYRVAQVQSDNYKGGKDMVSNLPDFVGKILVTKTTHAESDPTLTAISNVQRIGNKLICGSNAWGNTGSASIETLAANGWVECTASEKTTNRIFGLSDTNPDYNFTSIKYGIQLAPGGLYAIVNGVMTPATPISDYQPGDIIRIERLGSTIYFKRNGATINTIPNALTTSLLLDIAMNNQTGTLVGLRSSFSTTSRTITRRYVYDHAGRLLETWHKIDAVDQNDFGVRLVYNQYNELGQLIDKKLHSIAADGSDAKQSVDYRYNIRGWMTSINNSQLSSSNNGATNDDTNDFFGMNLLYNTTDSNVGNSALYNGNISGMTWSAFNGVTDSKELGYNFKYDAMNRLTDANSRKKKAGNWGAGEADENGLTYDLNGNIKTLNRTGVAGVQIDKLKYDYGTSGNQLQYVQDNATDIGGKIKGFSDGNINQNIDYSYDANGNMNHDLNKDIGTTLTDATNLITYNYLNLPEVVTKKNSAGKVQYIYDATGRKLSQVVSASTFNFKNTDYVGEFTYENDVLKYLSHEEGRIVVQKPQAIYLNDGGTLLGTYTNVSTTGTVATLATINGETYINVTNKLSGGTRCTLGNIGGKDVNTGIIVQPGERYLIRAKGFRNGPTPVIFIVRVNASIDLGTAASLPLGATAEGWIEKPIVIPSSVAANSKLTIGLGWDPVALGESFSVNDIEITKVNAAAPEYQYMLKDHLGNVRLSFTSAPETDAGTATMETANANIERSKFLYYDEAITVKHATFDHTNNVTVGQDPEGVSTRLTGGNTNAIYGLARSLSVMPGDVINMEVYGKYVDPQQPNWIAGFSSILTSIATPSNQLLKDGGLSGSLGGGSYPFTPLPTTDVATSPMAYIRYYVFNKDMTAMLNSGYKRITDAGREYGQNGPHDLMQINDVQITEPGYVYIYLCNENPTPIEVYFDDFKVTHVKSPVIASDDYYPFGLTYNSFSRENSLPNNRSKFQGQEYTDDLNLGWDSFKWRNHQPDIGRFFNVDPLAEKYVYNSPYAFAENSVIRYVELEGLEGADPQTGQTKKKQDASKQQTPDTNSLLYKFVWTWFTAANEVGKSIDIINGGDGKKSVKENLQTTGELVELAVFGTQAHSELINSGAGPGVKNAGPTTLGEEVVETSKTLRTAGKYPATIVGAELPNGATAIETSGDIPAMIAPSLEQAAKQIGGVGTSRAGNTIGCCGEFRAANKLLLDHPLVAPDAVKFTPAIRPRTGQVIAPCQNCKDIFKIK